MTDIAAAIAIGALIGLLSGLFGVGGSSVSTPLLRLILNTPRMLALASPLPVTIPTALVGSVGYAREGLINKDVILWSVAGGIPSMVLGALLTRWIPAGWLMYLIAGGVMVAGLRLATQEALAGAGYMSDRWRRAGGPALLAASAIIGLLSGLLANGGGFLLVPLYVILFGARMREAAATSLPCVAVLAVPGTIMHAILGHVDFALAAQLTVGVVPGSYLGTQMSLRWRSVSLRRPFGAFMLAFGVYFLITELPLG